MPVPTGTVQLNDGPYAIAGATLDVNGNYSVSWGSLTVGTHNLTAAYSGDSNFIPSTSLVVVEVVNQVQPKQASATSLAASPNPITVGQSCTMAGSVVGS